MEDKVLNARGFAYTAHNKVNHLYDDKSYSVHLNRVMVEASKHIEDNVPESDREDVLAACWLHDTIEDCRVTYNDLKKEFGGKVADIVYAVTNEKGKTRAERANDKYYEGIRQTPHASFVKMCDRLANVRYAVENSSRMIEVYRKENEEFLQKIFTQPVTFGQIAMIDELRNLLK